MILNYRIKNKNFNLIKKIDKLDFWKCLYRIMKSEEKLCQDNQRNNKLKLTSDIEMVQTNEDKAPKVCILIKTLYSLNKVKWFKFYVIFLYLY